MQPVREIAAFLEQYAPPELAEDWDNVGLLVGSLEACVSRLMTCLTITPQSSQEAIDRRADLIVSHHPLPFRPLKRLTSDSHEGRLLLDLIAAGVAVYSPHTAFDSALRGINQQLAEGLGLRDIKPLIPRDDQNLGAGRYGTLTQPVALRALVEKVKTFLAVPRAQVIGRLDRDVSRIAVACGSAGEFIGRAAELGCDVLLTGEARFHTCLEAEAAGVGLILAGHYASERFAVESLAALLSVRFVDLEIWPSHAESDPLQWI